MNAVAYVRVSSREQVSGTSLDSQEEAIRLWCARQGHELVEVFREAGASAKTADRPELQRLLGYCSVETVDLVVVWKYDRFARNVNDHTNLRSRLKSFGVEVVSATEKVEDDPAGKLMENVFAAFAQFDNDVRAQRSRQALEAKARDGYWIACAPLGYRTGRERGCLEPDPDSAEHVREAFREAATTSRSLEDIRRDLTARGMRTDRGNEVTPQSFHRMLRNPLYAGRVVVPSFGVDTEAAFGPLVSPEVWRQAQRRFDDRPQARSGDDEFPLRRFAFCAGCGTPYTGAITRSKGHAYGYYRCQSCTGTNTRRHQLHAAFTDRLDVVSVDAGVMPLFRELAVGLFRQEADRRGSRSAELSRELAALDCRERKLREAYIYDERIGPEVYEEELSGIQSRRSDVRRQLHQSPDPVSDPERVVERAEPWLLDPASRWQRAEHSVRREFQRVAFPGGVPVMDGQILKPPESPLYGALRGIERGQIERGGTGLSDIETLMDALVRLARVA